jgi:hypothetical protein
MAQQPTYQPPAIPPFMLTPEYIRTRVASARSEFTRLTQAAGIADAQWATPFLS